LTLDSFFYILNSNEVTPNKMRLLPKSIDFFAIFDKVASNISNAAGLFVSLVETFDNIDARAKEIHALEQDGDVLTHDIMKNLNKTFIK
jgi:uncharacterized protein Yka (UPF0111/DUF47 family)